MINNIIYEIQKLNPNSIVAIDGRCGAGKTTLASELQNRLSCNVIHMDDFFLRPHQRSEERLAEPGGNIDYERFIEEVLIPLQKNEPFTYKPYSCATQSFGEPIRIVPGNLTIVEGSYSCHPKFWDFYDLHIFLDVESEEQIRRIKNRCGEDGAINFQNIWIPLEEHYFRTYKIKEKSKIKAQST